MNQSIGSGFFNDPYLRLNFARVHGKNCDFAAVLTTALQLCRHVPKHLIERGLASSICPETILVLEKQGSGS